MRLTASDIVRAISQLPKNQDYNYVETSTRTKIIIDNIVQPEGPIYIKRYNPTQGRQTATRTSIPTNLIWRVANAIHEGVPVNLDRALAGSYNVRSAIEALLAHTPEFYFCYPGRIELNASSTAVKKGHKHLLWLPNKPHRPATMEETETQIVISEIATENVYESLVLPPTEADPDFGLDIDIKRRHAQIQVALVEIGQQLGFKTWVAQNDRNIVYNGLAVAEMTDVVATLDDVALMNVAAEARDAAAFIDVIWFKNGRLMPAVIEVEHSTRVTRGLARMKKLQDIIPGQRTRYVVAAADEDRELVLRECSLPQFRSLDTKFMSYTAVEELNWICRRRRIGRAVTDEFLDCYMESAIALPA